MMVEEGEEEREMVARSSKAKRTKINDEIQFDVVCCMSE